MLTIPFLVFLSMILNTILVITFIIYYLYKIRKVDSIDLGFFFGIILFLYSSILLLSFDTGKIIIEKNEIVNVIETADSVCLQLDNGKIEVFSQEELHGFFKEKDLNDYEKIYLEKTILSYLTSYKKVLGINMNCTVKENTERYLNKKSEK